MAKSLDHVLQPDGTYKWELVELKKPKTQESVITEEPTVEQTASASMTKKKKLKRKFQKRKLLAHYLTNSWQSKKK